jgi:hypothetical protein
MTPSQSEILCYPSLRRSRRSVMRLIVCRNAKASFSRSASETRSLVLSFRIGFAFAGRDHRDPAGQSVTSRAEEAQAESTEDLVSFFRHA